MESLVVDLVSLSNKMTEFVPDSVFLQGLMKLSSIISEDEWDEIFP